MFHGAVEYETPLKRFFRYGIIKNEPNKVIPNSADSGSIDFCVPTGLFQNVKMNQIQFVPSLYPRVRGFE